MEQGQIRISHLSKSYGDHTVFEDFSAVFQKGQTTCMMAPSGAGKTTLLRILAGLEKADSGQIEGLEGLRISMVFQEDRLCENLSASANIRLVRREKAVGQRQKVGGKDQQGYGGGGTWRMRGSAGAGVFRRDAAADSAFTCPLQ